MRESCGTQRVGLIEKNLPYSTSLYVNSIVHVYSDLEVSCSPPGEPLDTHWWVSARSCLLWDISLSIGRRWTLTGSNITSFGCCLIPDNYHTLFSFYMLLSFLYVAVLCCGYPNPMPSFWEGPQGFWWEVSDCTRNINQGGLHFLSQDVCGGSRSGSLADYHDF